MAEEGNKYPSVGKSYEIDQRAIKVFQNWLPDNWLPRPQTPDYFVDFLVEIVENGEPTGRHFAAQIKGVESGPEEQSRLAYSFKTKHLKYYFSNCQHPVFLFLINVAVQEGFWLFSQKHLKDISPKILDAQQSLTVHFSPDDSLLNSMKFKCLLPEAEKFVRDLHPGSIQAALQKRKAELESKDPRCSVSISIQNGKEHIIVNSKENFSFTLKVRNANKENWKDFFERGSPLKLFRSDFEIQGAPLIEDLAKSVGDGIAIRFGIPHPASVQVISESENGTKTISFEGNVRVGTKFLIFEGSLSNSPLSINFEAPSQSVLNNDSFQSEIIFSPSKWAGQHILWLSHFDQIAAFTESFFNKNGPRAEIYIRGNHVVTCDLSGGVTNEIQQMLNCIEWFRKCRWLAKHYRVNPHFPPLNELTKDQIEDVEFLYGLLSQPELTHAAPFIRAGFVAETTSLENVSEIEASFLQDGTLNFTFLEKTTDFFGVPVPVGALGCRLTEMKFLSKSILEDGKIEFTFEGNQATKQISKLSPL